MRKTLRALFDERFQGSREFADFVSCISREHVKEVRVKRLKTYKPDHELRAYLLFLKSVILKHARIHESSAFAYRKNFCTIDAVKMHTGGKFFFKTDLSNFFESVDSALVEQVLVENLEVFPVLDVRDFISHIVQLFCLNDRLPAGFPTSPGLSNACLYQFDSVMIETCERLGLVYSRYSDDIIVSGVSKDVIYKMPSVINSILHEKYQGRFSLNPAKSKFLHRRAKVELLGLIILPNGKITVEKSVREKLEVLLHFYSSNASKFIEIEGSDLAKQRKKIAGYLSHVRSLDIDYFKKVRERYGPSLVDDLMA